MPVVGQEDKLPRPSLFSLYISLSDDGCQVRTRLARDAFDGWMDLSIGDAAACRTAKDDASTEKGRKGGRKEGRTRRTEETRRKNTKYSAQQREEKAARSARECGRVRQMLKWIVWYGALE